MRKKRESSIFYRKKIFSFGEKFSSRNIVISILDSFLFLSSHYL